MMHPKLNDHVIKYSSNLCKEITLTAQQVAYTMTCKFDTDIWNDGIIYAPYIPNFMTKPKYKFSRAKWYVAEYDWQHYTEVIAWCAEQFGPYPRQHDAWSRWWDRYEGKVHFRDEKDYNWFLLRWGA